MRDYNTKCKLSCIFSPGKDNAWRENAGQLSLSIIVPHKFVTTQTNSRWIVEVLSLSETDTSVFKTHSTRSGSSSKSMSVGISTKCVFIFSQM